MHTGVGRRNPPSSTKTQRCGIVSFSFRHFQSEEFFLRLSDHVPDCMDGLV